MIQKIIAVSALGLLLSLPTSSFAQERNPQTLKALETLKQKIGNNFRVEWSEDGSRIIGLEMAEWSEKQIKKVPSLSQPQEVIGTPEEIAITFLQNNSELFQVPKDLADLRREPIKEGMPGEYSVELQQTYDGLPVLERGIYINMNLKGTRFTFKGVESVISDYVPNINISTTPLVSEQEAIAIAKQDTLQHHMVTFDKSGKQKALAAEQRKLPIKTSPHLERVIHVSEQEEPILAYRFRVEAAKGLVALEYLIDANSGTILRAGGTRQYASGKGDVFWPNPVNSANNLNLEDKNDYNDPALLPYYIRGKTLLDIDYDSASQTYILCGPYICPNDLLSDPVYFNTGPLPGSVSSSTGNFAPITNRSGDAFEHIMVYDVIDTNQRYIQTLGLGPINKRSIEVDPHALNNQDLSYYEANTDLNGNSKYIVFGEGGVDDAEDADIILHEYGHAIQDNQAPKIYAGFDFVCTTEAGAMAEGFGDYWAVSNTYAITLEHGFNTGNKPGAACYGEWDNVVKTPRDETNWCRRRVDGTKVYKNIVHDCHADGEIWSSALWDIFNGLGAKLHDKKVLGKKAADQLILRSHKVIWDTFKGKTRKPKFSDGGLALLKANQALVASGKFSSSNQGIICAALGKRGIAVNGPTQALKCPPPT